MSRIILLDTGPLGYVTQPRASEKNLDCSRWLEELLQNNVDVRIPEIADYECRRGYLRIAKDDAIKKLDQMKSLLGYVPITTAVMLKAAEFWATVRNRGFTTADDKALDGDVILAAQANILSNPGNSVIVATTNTKHIELLVPAMEWRDVQP